MQALANQIQAQGRGNDSVLVHMTPGEVSGLQALAQRHGGTLTRNPQTGLPEAGFLEDILPVLAGGLGGALGIDPWMVGAGVGAVTGLTTGNLEKGLMAGLGAYGGASLGMAANPGGVAGIGGLNQPPPPQNALSKGDFHSTVNMEEIYNPENLAQLNTLPAPVTPTTPPPGFMDRAIAASGQGLGGSMQGIAPWAAGLGLLMPFVSSDSNKLTAPKEEKNNYAGPYRPQPRKLNQPTGRDPKDSSEFTWFDPMNPYPGFLPAYASGGSTSRDSSEKTYTFARPSYVPPTAQAAPTAGLGALQAQNPTATAGQLNELDWWISGGGDPKVGKSLMQAYSPSSNISELQPWSKDFKGFDYKRSHPVDDFGNPIGWTLPEQVAPTTDANGVPSGWDPRDWENMKNTDLGNPDPEYILNNPWADDKIGGAFVGSLNLDPGVQWTKNSGGLSNDSPRIQQAYTSGAMDKILSSPVSVPEKSSSASPGNSAFLNALSKVAPSSSGLDSLTSGDATLWSSLGLAKHDPAAPKVGFGTGQMFNSAANVAGPIVGLPMTIFDILRNAIGGDLASAPASNTSGVLGNTISGPSMGADIGARINRLFGGTNKNAAGGEDLQDGSFIVDARTVSELGNGSSSAGQEILTALGGRPIHGPGDGVSDSIPAHIDGDQEARVARDEVKFGPEAVARIGGGDHNKGTAKLYEIMKKAHKARKSAGRGEDTGLRGLLSV